MYGSIIAHIHLIVSLYFCKPNIALHSDVPRKEKNFYFDVKTPNFLNVGEVIQVA